MIDQYRKFLNSFVSWKIVISTIYEKGKLGREAPQFTLFYTFLKLVSSNKQMNLKISDIDQSLFVFDLKTTSTFGNLNLAEIRVKNQFFNFTG